MCTEIDCAKCGVGNDEDYVEDFHGKLYCQECACEAMRDYIEFLELPTLSCEMREDGLYEAVIEGCERDSTTGEEYEDALRNLYYKLKEKK